MASIRLHLDWSGDLGLKLGRGASSHAALVAVAVPELSRFVELIADLRRRGGAMPTMEYHFAKVSQATRDAYFGLLQRIPFSAWGLLVDKGRLPTEFARSGSDELLCHLVAELARRIPAGEIAGALLIVDEQRSKTRQTRKIRVAVSRVLQERDVQPRLAGCRGMPAHRDDGVQLADMIAGGIIEARVADGRDYITPLGSRVTVTEVGSPAPGP